MAHGVTVPAARGGAAPSHLGPGPESEGHAAAEGRIVSKCKCKQGVNTLPLQKCSSLTWNAHAAVLCLHPTRGQPTALLSQEAGPSGMGRAPEARVSVCVYQSKLLAHSYIGVSSVLG